MDYSKITYNNSTSIFIFNSIRDFPFVYKVKIIIDYILAECYIEFVNNRQFKQGG